MNYTNLFKIAVRAIAANKMRSFLTALGIIMSFAVCSFTSIFFGWYPAKKAAMLDPIAGFIGTQDISRVQSLQKDHVCNLLITNALHASAVGAGFIEAAENTFVNKNCKQAFVFDPIKRGKLKKIRLLFASQSAKSYKLKDFCYTPLFLGYFFSSLGLSPSYQRRARIKVNAPQLRGWG